MPVEHLLDISHLDPTKSVFGPDEIRAVNPHRHEFELIDGILEYQEDPVHVVGVKYVREDQFWCRGHLPGDPIFPGVLVVEAGAQVASFCFIKHFGSLKDRFFGFGGIEDTRFRGAVRPGDDLVLVIVPKIMRLRRAIFRLQAYVRGTVVCESTIIGVTVPKQG